jgi:hypothetical protein
MAIKWMEIRWLAHCKRREMKYRYRNEPESIKVVEGSKDRQNTKKKKKKKNQLSFDGPYFLQLLNTQRG